MEVRRIDLERARREAKELLAAARAGDPAARARLAPVARPLQLASAQLAIARELGEPSWPALVRRAERESATTRERAEAFVRAATSDRLDHADALLAGDPSIVRALPAAALVLGEPVAVDPRAPLAPLDWLPLVYIAHSRYLGGSRSAALVASAERLLDAGADPDTAFVDPRFGAQSALYGAAGVAHEPQLTRLLLERGANPDDHESLYHATESTDPTCVRLLLEAGATVAGTNALAHALDREDLPLVELLLAHGPSAGERWPELTRSLSWAIFRNRSTRIVRLLADRGAALERPDRRTGRTPYALAIARGRNDIAELLVELGAQAIVSPVDLLVGDCVRGDRAAALARTAADPGLAARARDELGQALVTAAGEGRVEATALLLDIGAPIDAQGDLAGSPFHHAAWNGRGGTVDLLLRRGADPLAIAPAPTHSSPLAWAAHGSRHAHGSGDAYLGIGRRLVAEGAERDPALADEAVGDLADWLRGRDVDVPAPAPAPGEVDYGELAIAAQIEQLRLLASSPGVVTRPVGEGFALASRVSDNTLNGVVCDHCDESVADAIAWLDGLSAQWHVGASTDLHQRLLDAGARPERSAVVMGAAVAAIAADPIGPPRAIREIADRSELESWLDVAEDGNAIDGPQARLDFVRLFANLALDDSSPLRLQVAWEGDLAVGGIAARRQGDLLVLEHLGVRGGSRRLGIGRALIASAVRAERGVAHVVLSPTPSSAPFYERVGFVLQRYPANRAYYLPVRSGESA